VNLAKNWEKGRSSSVAIKDHGCTGKPAGRGQLSKHACETGNWNSDSLPHARNGGDSGLRRLMASDVGLDLAERRGSM